MGIRIRNEERIQMDTNLGHSIENSMQNANREKKSHQEMHTKSSTCEY